jgi:hypothetical protein
LVKRALCILGGVAVAWGGLILVPAGVSTAQALEAPSSGAPHGTALSKVVTASRSGTSKVELGRPPHGATNISLTLICHSAGTFEFPDNSSASCSLQQPSQQSTEVVPLSPAQHSVTITATPRAKWTLRAVYIRQVMTLRPVSVPNVIGMTSAQASNALTKRSLGVAYGLVQVKPGERVVYQAPTVGALVEPGSAVAVRFSRS